jgi:hypothetical protein
VPLCPPTAPRGIHRPDARRSATSSSTLELFLSSSTFLDPSHSYVMHYNLSISSVLSIFLANETSFYSITRGHTFVGTALKSVKESLRYQFIFVVCGKLVATLLLDKPDSR